ncbi:TPA: transcriptional regulator [Escherichia coli]|uniref:PapB/FocB family fimbrial expression transcriptional regulator n=1 Tax=Escherichia coli TaxID=562 RepID=UPI0015D76800|nr:PapB/FocB family fimbrial expression transcriptional regulator [Escherichia coli]ELL3233718.1 transcriptional regulator [Escherichia coli]MED8143342.1 PapB/FocB family fimbrial expression transcriptional regulator [Escherichia coli]NZD29007.1 transcriptional regulator [Escherichia coli]HCO5960979.1 transcriptional regulator [Escherichia coli]HCO6110599.1 transcriptional regulator [Escherichia coli]
MRLDRHIVNEGQNSSFLIARKGKITAGELPEEQFWLLIDISPIYSEKLINAMREHLVYGISRKEVCGKYCVSNSYLSTGLNKLYHVNRTILKLICFYHKK